MVENRMLHGMQLIKFVTTCYMGRDGSEIVLHNMWADPSAYKYLYFLYYPKILVTNICLHLSNINYKLSCSTIREAHVKV